MAAIDPLSRDQFGRARLTLPFGRLLLAGGMSLALGLSVMRAETPTQAVDRVWSAWGVAGPQADAAAAKRFRMISKAVAREQGTAVIDPIMARAKDWQGEEVLIFVTTVAFLPKDKAVPVLERYKKDGKPWEKQAATDLLIEIDSDDVKEMLQHSRDE